MQFKFLIKVLNLYLLYVECIHHRNKSPDFIVMHNFDFIPFALHAHSLHVPCEVNLKDKRKCVLSERNKHFCLVLLEWNVPMRIADPIPMRAFFSSIFHPWIYSSVCYMSEKGCNEWMNDENRLVVKEDEYQQKYIELQRKNKTSSNYSNIHFLCHASEIFVNFNF